MEYYIRVIEVTKGKKKGGETWLSKVTKETIGDAKAGYSNAIIKLDRYTSDLLCKGSFVVEEKIQDLGEWKWGDLYYDKKKRPCKKGEHTYHYPYKIGTARDLGDSAFPNLYMPDPKIPTKYKRKFNPDFIFPEERYVILVPKDAIINPTVKIPDSIWGGTWIGLVFGGSFTYKFGGADGKLGVIFQLSALWEDNVSYSLAFFSGVGGHVGIGMGGHVETNLIFFFNAKVAQQIEGFEWGPDWDLVFGTISGKQILGQTKKIEKMLQKVFKKSGIFGKLSKITGLGKRNIKYLINSTRLRKMAKYIKDLDNKKFKNLVETLLKNTISNGLTLAKGGEVISLQFPLVSGGKHVFVGLRGIRTDILAQYNYNPKVSSLEELYKNKEIQVAILGDNPIEITPEFTYKDFA
ncbi:MAG: hypothetical protein GY754_41605 [bacterium]|nr:hypothetical protein [bacterium]